MCHQLHPFSNIAERDFVKIDCFDSYPDPVYLYNQSWWKGSACIFICLFYTPTFKIGNWVRAGWMNNVGFFPTFLVLALRLQRLMSPTHDLGDVPVIRGHGTRGSSRAWCVKDTCWKRKYSNVLMDTFRGDRTRGSSGTPDLMCKRHFWKGDSFNGQRQLFSYSFKFLQGAFVFWNWTPHAGNTFNAIWKGLNAIPMAG